MAIPSENQDKNEAQEDGVYRYDVSAAAWTGPPANAIGWWANEVPRAEQARVRPAKPIELLDRLSALCDDPNASAIASLFATLLVRRRILVPNPNHESETAGAQSDTCSDTCPGGFTEYLHRGTNSHFRVPSIELVEQNSAQEDKALHLRLQNLLVVEVDDSSIEPAILTEPMALATGVDSPSDRKLAPEASAYGSGELEAGS
ncbi:MAG: hypothetical protein NTW52_08575 [Planctomycetota bacterium]|nr:hypothetical protein [Planctomycetota bacterium]